MKFQLQGHHLTGDDHNLYETDIATTTTTTTTTTTDCN